jgi:hypothetical protein
MDCEVFVLSRMREERARAGDNSKAVARGLARTRPAARDWLVRRR